MKKMLPLFVLTILSGLVFAGNPPKKMLPKLDNGESSNAVPTNVRAKVNESILIGNSANAYAWQAAGTNQIYYDVASGTLAVTKRRGTLDTAIPSGSGRIVNHMSTDAGATWSAGLEVNGTLAQVFGRHPNVAILPSGEMITQWAELYPAGAGFQAMGMATNKLSDNSLLSAYLDVEIVAEIDDVAGNDTVGYSVPDEIFVDEKNGTFYFGGAADGATNTVYLWKSSNKGASHQLVKLWKDAEFGGISAGGNPSHGDFFGDYGTYIASILPDSAYAVANGLSYENYAPYVVRFKNGSIVEEGFVNVAAAFASAGIDSWTYEWDMVTDKDGNWHMFIQGYLDGTEATNLGIYELYSKTPGLTDLGIKKVADITLLSFDYGTDALTTLADIHASRDAEGKYVFVKYLDWDPTDAPETSTEVFVSGRAISSEAFVTPIATNDNDLAVQYFSQAAPRVSAKGAGDVAGTAKFQIHSSWVEYGGTPAAGTAAANVYYNGPTLDVAEYTGGSTPTDAKLTFVVNTAFVQDTLSANHTVSLRGTAFGGDWSYDKSVKLSHVAGDYWQGEVMWPIGTSSGGGFKVVTSSPTGTGWDRHQIGAAQITGDDTYLIYTTGLPETYIDPFTGASVTRADDWDPLEIAKKGATDVYAVHFRVNMQGVTAFKPENHTVTVRGGFNGWSAADTLKAESRHDDIGQTPYEAEKYFFSKTVLIPKASAGVLKYKFVWSDAGGVSTNWEDKISDRPFTLAADTTLGWVWFDNVVPPKGTGDKPFKVSFTVDMEKAINTNGFDKSKDTLIARIGFMGTGFTTVDAKLETPFAGTEFTGETGLDSLKTEFNRVVMYQYYKKNADGEFEEFYFDNFNTAEGASAPKFRKLTIPASGNTVSTEDILNDAVSTHRQPFFKNTSKLGVATTFTLEVNLLPAYLLVEHLGGSLNDIQGGALIVDASNIRTLDLYVNGPATGSWGPWNAVGLGETRKATYKGQGLYTWTVDYTADAIISQEFKLGIGGADNEAGFGNNHMANLFPTATNNTSVQFGDIQPSRYKVDENNYWNFATQTGYKNGLPWTALSVDGSKAATFALLQNYPNPFNPSTMIPFTVAAAGNVNFAVYNIMGQEVSSFSYTAHAAGLHQVNFSADNLATGTYLVKMTAGSNTKTIKMVFMK